MAESLKRLAGWEDLAALPEGGKAEVLAGELQVFPRPRPAHGRTQAAISGSLWPPFDHGTSGPGGWWIVIEPDVQFGPHDIVNPDLVGWRRERMPAFPEVQPIAIVPDWVCEVVSPRTARRDRTVKADLYLRSGVPHYWLVDIDLRAIEALEAHSGRWVRLGAWSDGERARIPPFDAIEIEVGSLFPPAAEPEAGP
jgi:Uma2 family endonuclease